ncbi:aldehyde dehydrogenase family protein [Ensifer adhaerens]|uniref:aldehyde dehydrogenase family protein n=1 Tax=Ensifer adhaerens TaxID=106592 RepID=UPI001CBE0194|nr:aldehyde dehydrogenase family protein [Ensifer adhaerens]MBZ7927599.1 aldehyde dehydrogenase family protein [Ensifer adhaerens]
MGLSSYVFTASSSRAHHTAQALAADLVSINHFGLALPETPFGGINGSGYGSEGGIETISLGEQECLKSSTLVPIPATLRSAKSSAPATSCGRSISPKIR